KNNSLWNWQGRRRLLHPSGAPAQYIHTKHSVATRRMASPQLFVPDPSTCVPINPDLKCAEEWTVVHASYDEDDDGDDDDDDDDLRGPITFHVTLPNGDTKLKFNCRDKSSGVLLPTEPNASEPEIEDNHVIDPFFFEKGFYLEAKTGFQPWPGSRLMVEAFTCDIGSEPMRYWQHRLRNKDLTMLEVGAGIGLVGTCLAAAGANILVTDLPVLVKHAIWPNLKRNGDVVLDESAGEVFLKYSRIGKGLAGAAVLDWFKPISEQLSYKTTSQFDVIIACDCLFLRKIVDPLLSIISSLFESSAKSPRLLFTYQRRNQMGVFIGLEELLARMEKKGWEVKCLAWRRITVEDDGEHDLYLFEAGPSNLEQKTCAVLEEKKKDE
ncbi:hypothetical protein ACHAWF_015876, partial [Thalassiosira exigua]